MNPSRNIFPKIAIEIINTLMKAEKNHYVSPQTEEVEISLEKFICGSTRMLYYYDPGSAGEDIENEDIINGGSF